MFGIGVIELLLYVLIIGTVTICFATIKHYGLLMKAPRTQLEEKRQLTDEVMRILHGMRCPLCSGPNTHVKMVDLWRHNLAIMECETCKQDSLWELRNFKWHLVAPFRHRYPLVEVPSALLTRRREKIELKFERPN